MSCLAWVLEVNCPTTSFIAWVDDAVRIRGHERGEERKGGGGDVTGAQPFVEIFTSKTRTSGIPDSPPCSCTSRLLMTWEGETSRTDHSHSCHVTGFSPSTVTSAAQHHVPMWGRAPDTVGKHTHLSITHLRSYQNHCIRQANILGFACKQTTVMSCWVVFFQPSGQIIMEKTDGGIYYVCDYTLLE